MFRRLLATFLFAALLASQARADLIAEIQGIAISGSAFNPSTGPNVDLTGKPFDVQAVINPSTGYSPAPGVGYYTPSSITVTVGSGMTATTYTASVPANGLVILLDQNSVFGSYVLQISGNGFGTFLDPEYTNATPSLSAVSPSATVFSGYQGSNNDLLDLTTSNGTLLLSYDSTTGPTSASISSVPEPTSLVYFAEATLLGLGILAYRRRQAVAGV